MSEDQLYFLVAALAIFIVWQYSKLKKQKKEQDKLQRKNVKLEADNALLEAEHLKFQLQPHTLNNILANLKVIANKLNKGLYSLSETLEYILYKGNNHFVSVKDELNFIDEYLKLNELFITEIDSITKDFSQVNEKSKFYNTPCIPHLISAYFIENAFKHGDTSNKEFLKIKVRLTDKEFEMTVINKVSQKPTSAKGGLGLSNMKKRLDLLSSNKYDIHSNVNGQEYHSTLIIQL